MPETTTPKGVFIPAPDPDRAPADDMLKETILDGKCGKSSVTEARKFYQFCNYPQEITKVNTTCYDIHSSGQNCSFVATISPKGSAGFKVCNVTSKFNHTDSSPTHVFDYQFFCDYGTKTQREDLCAYIYPSDNYFEKCKQMVEGLPWNMPWWMILLIVMLILTAVISSAIMFWRCWLRDQIYPPRDEQGLSAISSVSQAPYSTSGRSAVSRAPSTSRKGRRASSHKGGSRVSRAPSVRSRLPSSS